MLMGMVGRENVCSPAQACITLGFASRKIIEAVNRTSTSEIRMEFS